MQLAYADEQDFVPQKQTTYEEEGKLRLEAWAKWSKGVEGARGYQTVEPFTKLVTPTDDGPIGPMPADVAETDRAVSILRFRHKSKLWKAIEQAFLRNDAVTVSMKACGTSRSGYYRLVSRAQRRVMDLIREERDSRAAPTRIVALVAAR